MPRAAALQMRVQNEASTFGGFPVPIQHFKEKSKQPTPVNAGKKCWDASAIYFGKRQ